LVLAVFIGRVTAADPPPSKLITPLVPQGYRAPSGFGAARWGDSLANISLQTHGLKVSFVRQVVEAGEEHGLKCYNNGSAVAFSSAQTIQNCLYDGPTYYIGDPVPPPKPPGFYLFAEYSPALDMPEPFEGVMVNVHYGLCTLHPPQTGQLDPIRFNKKDLRLCAVRLSSLGRELLASLVKRFGSPSGYTEDMPAGTLLEHYRWCGSRPPRESYIPCPAAVAFAFDPKTLQSEAVFATPAVYAFFAQLNAPDSGNSFKKGAQRYYVFLYDQPLRLMPKKGPFICPTCAVDRFEIFAGARRALEPDP